jgi:TrmH family RNA methyltransferase
MQPARREITSAKNPVIHRFRDAGEGRIPGLLLAEGARLVREALAAGLVVHEAAVSPRCQDLDLVRELEARATTFLDCSDEALAKMSALDTPPGVAVLVERPPAAEADLLGGPRAPLVVVAAGVGDPGNLGSILRAAEAAGASGCITLQGGADPFRDKAVRGSMGSVFRLPVLAGLGADAVVDFAGRHRLQVVAADGGSTTDYTAVDLRLPTLLVLGAEAAGVPAGLLAAADARIRIPLQSPVESLNVAVAAGVLLFEARRQRG